MIVVTLACVYLGSWEATKRRGVRDVAKHMTTDDQVWMREYLQISPRVAIPFIVSLKPNGAHPEVHFWFFGYVAKLPYERDLQ